MPLRRSARVNVRTRVMISGALPGGAPFSGEAFVENISKYGARLQTKLPLAVGAEVKVQPEGREPGLFQVVWVGQPGTHREGEVGIEYVRVSNLLGISFPD